MAELKTHKSRIGKGLINMLMFQMYGDEKLIYREYVQNARDAINDAVNHGILGAITDGRISITIDSAKRFIEIRDNWHWHTRRTSRIRFAGYSRFQ